MIAILVALALAGLIYLLPNVIAIYLDHPNRWLVSAINAMSCLTVLGWAFELRKALKPLPSPCLSKQQLSPRPLPPSASLRSAGRPAFIFHNNRIGEPEWDFSQL